jgi:rubrerythrin
MGNTMEKHMKRKSLIITVMAMAAAISTTEARSETISAPAKRDLLTAMRDEAFSHLRYKMFAEQARKNGNEALAGLFEKIGEVELNEHFKEQAQIIGLVKTDRENLTTAVSDEYLETARMYMEMAKRAEESGDSKIAQHFSAVAADEAEHQKAFKAMLGKGAGAAN